MTKAEEMKKRIMESMSAHYCLKEWIERASEKDPVDALRNAEVLVQYCKLRVSE